MSHSFDQNANETSNVSNSFTFLGISLLVLVTWTIIMTIYEHLKPNAANSNELLSSFSLKKNISSLMSLDRSNPADTINCLHGFRAISLIAILYVHTYIFRFMFTSGNEEVINDFIQTSAALNIASLSLLVEVFFVISATLFTRSTLKALTKWVNWGFWVRVGQI